MRFAPCAHKPSFELLHALHGQGLDKMQDVLSEVMRTENRPCKLCGSRTQSLALASNTALANGNKRKYSVQPIEQSSHLGSATGVTRDFLGNEVGNLTKQRRDAWKGDGKCKHCHGSGKEPPKKVIGKKQG